MLHDPLNQNNSVTIAESYQHCRRMASRSGSSFTPCFRLLPSGKRRAMEVLYAFMLHTDSIADDTDVPIELRHQQLAQWQATVSEYLDTNPSSCADGTACTDADETACTDVPDEAVGNVPDTVQAYTSVPIMPAVREMVRQYGISAEYLQAVIDGVASDLSPVEYRDWDQLADYCDHVATAVGLASMQIWGFRDDPASRDAARACGLALQMTNILRDIREDYLNGRVYLPLDELAQFDLDHEALGQLVYKPSETDPRFERFMQFQIERVEELYRQADPLVGYLSRDSRRLYCMMKDVYHHIFLRIAKDPSRVLRERVRLSRVRKLAILARWLLGPVRV